MNIKQYIKESYLFSIILYFIKLSETSFLFKNNTDKKSKSVNGSKDYIDSIDTSYIYKYLSKIDLFFMSIEKNIYNSLINSAILGRIVDLFNNDKSQTSPIKSNSKLYNLLYKFKGKSSWMDLLILVPASYVLVDYIIRNTRGIVKISSVWDELILLILLAYYIVKRVMSGGKIRYRFTSMDLPAVLYILSGIVHVMLVRPSLSVAIEGFRSVFQQILWYFLATQFIRTKEDRERVIDVMVSIGLFMGIHAVYQYIANVPMPGNWVDATENIRTRAFSIIGSPNILGVIFVLLIPISISMFFTNKNNIKKNFYLVSSLFMTIGLLLTMSRGAWLAFALAIFIYIIVISPKMILPFIGVVGVFILFGGTLSERLLFMLSPTYFIKSAAGGRLYRWEIGIDVWKQSKFLGVGLGRYGGAVAMNNKLSPFYLDNYYLKTLTEMGIFGILGLLFVIVCFIVFSMKIIKNQNQIANKLCSIGLFAGAMGVLAQNFVENIFEVPAIIAYFWIFVALINTFKPENHQLVEEERSI